MDVPQKLAAAIEDSHGAVDAFLRGNPAPLQELYSKREDVTLANPFGPAQRGWPAVGDTMARAAANYLDGRARGFDQVATFVADGLACVHEVEHCESKVGDSDERTRFSLRCTTVFRLEDGDWKIVHRHADPISGPRPAESVTQT